MDFAPDTTTQRITRQVRDFVTDEVLPAEPVLADQLAATPGDWSFRPVVRHLQATARERGLWNLFLPPGGPVGNRGGGLTNLQYAPVAELTGYSPRLAPVAMNCAAPDTGNMELLAHFATPGAARTVARPAAGGRAAVRVLHDRARRSVVRRHEHRHPDSA